MYTKCCVCTLIRRTYLKFGNQVFFIIIYFISNITRSDTLIGICLETKYFYGYKVLPPPF